MKTKLANTLAALSVVSLLVSLSPFAVAAQPLDTPEIAVAAEIAVAVQNTTTQRAHEELAKHYEDAAVQMQAKVVEKKELLEHYEDKSYLYGRQAQDLQSHTHALIRSYEKTVRKNLQTAALHRQMAARLNETHAASSTQVPDTVSGL